LAANDLLVTSIDLEQVDWSGNGQSQCWRSCDRASVLPAGLEEAREGRMEDRSGDSGDHRHAARRKRAQVSRPNDTVAPCCATGTPQMIDHAVLPARAQFAFTMAPHIIFPSFNFPSFTIGLIAWIATLEARFYPATAFTR
jgi:hypothetical protein